MFHTSTNHCQNMDFFNQTTSWFPLHSSPLEWCHGFLVALSSLICLQNFLPWHSQPSIADYTKCRSLCTVTTLSAEHCTVDYTKCRSMFKQISHTAENSLQISTGTEARGYHGVSILNPQGVKFVHGTKTKYKDKNDTKCNNFTL